MSLLAALSAIRTRKTVLAAISATMIAGGLGLPNTASAKPFPYYGYGYGYGAAALAGGLALGAIAASAASAGTGDCVIERRRLVDQDGFVYVRSVRVCY
ncbi:hypothetical protein [Methylobacterium haplocladii]|uniref:Transmembrane protein n=1 Tax=Methylobacterium haplocladii TaxID=1176176 RepID=A0A512ILW6_9HYPH|nr:hypothetical protein [Methylobacterium haplocladii]GEO98665.1 hypothetical protein MHA02_10530 [Methylobacterium haplocladii]GJD83934.1 hypothetical protein HPGCJGGD_1808 [Methylobacterium haplocladii]GLS57685.1 hypothetical protein GCM10007887_03410 [Methylobacterium haplocladii]